MENSFLTVVEQNAAHWLITNKRIDYVMGFGGRICESVELRRITEMRYERDCLQFMLCGRGTIVVFLDEYSPVDELVISGWGLRAAFQKLRLVWLAARLENQNLPVSGRMSRAEEDELIRRKLSQAGIGVSPPNSTSSSPRKSMLKGFESAEDAAEEVESEVRRGGGGGGGRVSRQGYQPVGSGRRGGGGGGADVTSSAPPTPASSY